MKKKNLDVNLNQLTTIEILAWAKKAGYKCPKVFKSKAELIAGLEERKTEVIEYGNNETSGD